MSSSLINQVALQSGIEKTEVMSGRATSYLIGRANRVMSVALTQALERRDVTVMELTALSVIADRPGLSNARLARRSLVSPQAMHKLVSALHERGLVARNAGPDGGRALATHITPAGEQLLEELEPVRRAAEDHVLDGLAPTERAEFTRLLSIVARVDPG
jgi:DNA-binding MarR family transcriptional regulator